MYASHVKQGEEIEGGRQLRNLLSSQVIDLSCKYTTLQSPAKASLNASQFKGIEEKDNNDCSSHEKRKGGSKVQFSRQSPGITIAKKI